jgi:DNA helicase INO80
MDVYHSAMLNPVKKEVEEMEGTRQDANPNYHPSGRSPTQDYRPPYSPNGHRPQFDPRYAASSLPIPPQIPSQIPVPPTSPRTSSSYATDYKPVQRENKYYDPTSDSIERPSETPTYQHTPQVSIKRELVLQLLTSFFFQSREPYIYPPSSADPPKYYNGTYTSPVTSNFPRSPISHHAHPAPPPIQHSPAMASHTPSRQNGINMGRPVIKQEPVCGIQF